MKINLFFFAIIFLFVPLSAQSEQEIIHCLEKSLEAEDYLEVLNLGKQYLALHDNGSSKPVAYILMLESYLALSEDAKEAEAYDDTLLYLSEGFEIAQQLLSLGKTLATNPYTDIYEDYFSQLIITAEWIQEKRNVYNEEYRDKLDDLYKDIPPQYPFPWPPPRLEWPKEEEREVFI